MIIKISDKKNVQFVQIKCKFNERDRKKNGCDDDQSYKFGIFRHFYAVLL